jgi:hypothetical protein
MAVLMFPYSKMPFHSPWMFTGLKQINYYYNKQQWLLRVCQVLLIISEAFKMMELNSRSILIISGKDILDGLLQLTFPVPGTRY